MALTRLDNLYSSKTGKYLYVSPDDFNASDELDNRGNSPLRPFKTIQRAFIEVARFSYLPGSDNDRFDQFSIMLMPGDHYIDNRPGLVQIDRRSRQRYYDARNLINANRQEIIDRSFAEIAIQYDEVAWGTDWVVPGDDPAQTKSRYYDAYRLIQKNKQEIIDRSVAEIALGPNELFSFPEDATETEVSRYKDAYRLIRNNQALIVDDVWQETFASYPSVGSTQTKCKRDLGYFIEAIALDVFGGGGNRYSREFVLKYFDGAGNPIPEGIPNTTDLIPDPDEINASIFAFERARDYLQQAVSNNYVSVLSPGSEYTDNDILEGEAVYNDGAGDVSRTDPTACSDVQTTIANLVTTITTPILNQTIAGGNLASLVEVIPPAGEAKCKRDLGFIVDYISLDIVQGGGNVYTRKVMQNYFNEAGNDWIDDGLQGETAESLIAFNKARDVMLQAITNQLYYKDLTITADIATGDNQDPASCNDVQTLIGNLFQIVIDAVTNESIATVDFPPESTSPLNPGEEKCKRDIGYIVDATAADLQNGGNAQIVAATKAYFDANGLPISNGLVGEEAQSVVAFSRAATEMQKAVTNQLLSKDLTLLAGPANFNVEGPTVPVLPSGNAASCVDVQSSIADLITIATDVISSGDISLLVGINAPGDVPVFNYNQNLEEWNDNTILDLSNPDNALYKFNSSTGGAIVPRGCSLIGYDLRRTIVRPLYVPDPAGATQERTSIFNLTGGCYLWQFTIKDGDLSENSPLYNPTDKVGRVYYQKGNTNLATPEYSHHKICIMTYADEQDLEDYYEKVGRSFSLFQPTIDDGDLEALVQENRIVGPLSDTRNITNIRLEDNVDASKVTVVVTTKIAHGYFKDQYVAIIDNGLTDLLNGTFKVIELDNEDPRVFKYELGVTELQLGLDLEQDYDFTSVPALDVAARVQAEIDSVESASPYVFNCSIRSTWGQCGMWADGSKATGFKSMVVAQYTGVSLQRDDRAYIRYDEFTNTWNQASITDAFATEPYHTRGDAYWKDDWRNFHIRASDDAFIQCVSVFAVGFFDHFLMESGGDMSITNSNSNFGNTSLHAIGFKGFAFNQDKGGYITDIIPLKTIDDSAFNETDYKYYSLDAQLTKDAANTTGRLYYGADTIYDPFDKPVVSIDGYRLGAKSGERLYLTLKDTVGGNSRYEAELSESGFTQYTASIQTLNPDGLVIDNLAQDASTSIEKNKLFIQQEAYGYIIDKYPYLLTKPGIEIGKCERDIGYFVDAVVQDLRVGGNIQTIQAAEAYFVGGSLSYVPGELNETVEALDYVKNLCVAAMRNFDILYRDCQTTVGSAIVDVGDTTGLLVGMRVREYDYTLANFQDGRLNPDVSEGGTSQEVTVNPAIQPNTYIKKIIDSTRIELGIEGSLPSTLGDIQPAQQTRLAYLYFSLPRTGTLTDSDDNLVGAWAAQIAVADSSIIQYVDGNNAPVPWNGLQNEYPECASIRSTIETYFSDINVILNQGLQPISERESALSTLILANKDLATEEALDRAKANYPTLTLNNQVQLVADVKETIEAYAYNVLYGANNKAYDRGVFYTANPSRTNGEELFTTFLYDEVYNILVEVIRNETVTIIGDHGLTQTFDNSIVPDTPPFEPGTYGLTDFVDIQSNLGDYRDLVNAGIGTDVIVGDVTNAGIARTEPVVGASVGRVDPTLQTANLANRATLFTVNTGGGVSDPHNWETGTPVRLVPNAREGTNPDKRVIRLPRGFEPNTIYYVIAPGRTTQPENYANGLVYPGVFEADSKTRIMLASTKENAAAGIYLYSSETDSIDPDLEIGIQQFVLDVDYALHQYLCNEVSGVNDVLQTGVPHLFDVPGTGGPVQKVFFRTFGNNSDLPVLSASGVAVDPNTYYYARFVTPRTFSIFLTEAEAISGATPQTFIQGFGQNFYVFSDKRRSPVKFDAELVNTNTTTGQWYIQTIPDPTDINVEPGSAGNMITRLQALGVTLTDARTKNTFFNRLDDGRPKEDRVYRLRYVIPRYARGVRDPLNGFVLKTRTDETRRLVPQRIVLQNIAAGAPVATFNVPFNIGTGTIQQALGLPEGDVGLNPDFDYDAYNSDQVKIIDSDRVDSKTSFSILSARQIDIGGVGDPADLRLELTVFNHSINNNALKNEKFTVVKIDAPQGGTGIFRTDDLQATNLNRITWSGYSSGAGYLQGYFNPDGTNDHYLIIKAIESREPIEYNQFASTRFAQPVLNLDNDPTFDVNGNPIEIYATLQAKPDSVGNEALSKSTKEDYLYSNKDANVLTMVPGDVIEDDTSTDYEIISVEDVGDFEDSFYIFDINEIQRRIPDQQEGIYYLTCLRGNISPFPTGAGVGQNFRNFKFSQPISQLYPLDYKNDPLWFQVRPDGTRDDTILDPPSTICAADNYVHGLVRTNDNKNSETKEVVEDLILNPALSRYNYTIEAQSGNATSGSEDRRISIAGDSLYKQSGENKLFVELRRPSIARSGNHTFEYLGFGPGNYSTGFPLRQEVVLSDIQDFYAQSKKEDAGIVFYTGLNSNGDLYIGNRKINAITGEETFLESAELQETEDEGGDLGGLVTTFELPVVFERDITVDGDANFNNPVTITVDPDEAAALTIVSNVDFSAGGDQTLDSSSFNFSPIPSNGNIVATQNNIYAAIFRLNPRGNTTLAGQNYSIRTHVNSFDGNNPSNHSPHQTLSTLGIPILYGNQTPQTGDILLKGEQVGKTGSLGWIYSNFFVDVTTATFTISADSPPSTTVIFATQPGTSPSDLGIQLGTVVRLTGFDGRFNNINGVRTVTNVNDVQGGTWEVTSSFIIAGDPGDPTLLTSLTGTPLIEVSVDSWKETGLLGTESLRTLTDNNGDYRLGINTLARSDHGVDGDQEEGFVSDAVLPRANLDVVGTTWISGRTLDTVVNNYINNPLLADRTFLDNDHAFLVGGLSEDPGQEATFRISTTNGGRVGINVDFSELDRTLVVDGDMRLTNDFLLEQNLTIGGESLITQTQNFNLVPNTTTRLNFGNVVEELNIANQTTEDQEINIGNIAGGQIFNIGTFSLVTEFNLHRNAQNSIIRAGTVANDDVNFSSVVLVGGAYANTSDDLLTGSILKVYNRFAYFDGDIRVGQALSPGTGIASISSPAQTFNLLTTTVTNINIGLSASDINIGALGGITRVNNSLEVGADTDLFGDVTLQGGLNAGQFELRRGSLGTPTTAHSIGNEVDNFNIDFYRRTETSIRLSTEGAEYWGNEAEFKDNSVGFASDPTVYRLTIDQPATLLDFEVGSYVLIDRSIDVGPTQGDAPVGEQYSELLEVIGIINLSDVGPEPLQVRVRRARNQLDSAGNMILGTPADLPVDAEPPLNYKYLRTDHPDQAVLVRYDFSRNVSYLNENLNQEAPGFLDDVATGNFAGSINEGDIFRLSPDENGNLGELTTVTGINQVTNQQFLITDGGTPPLTAFSVDSVTGETFINGQLDVNNSIILSGSVTCGVERLVLTDGTGNPDFEKFIVDSCDGTTSIRGNLQIGTDNFDRFVVEGPTGDTTITEGNLVIENDLGDQQLVLQNSSGNLTIAGIIRTEGTAQNIFSGDVVINGSDFIVNADSIIDRSGSNLTSSQVGETIASINNDGSFTFAGQSAYLTPTGGRNWEYIGGGVAVAPLSSNVNYFIAPAADILLELPQLPTHGDVIRILDVGGQLTYNVSLRIRAVDGTRVQGGADNSGPIAGTTFDGGELLVQTPNVGLGLVYLGSVDYRGVATGASIDTGWWLMEI